jgi:hypothetical protein
MEPSFPAPCRLGGAHVVCESLADPQTNVGRLDNRRIDAQPI